MKKSPDTLTPFGEWLFRKIPHWHGRNYRYGNIEKGLISPCNRLLIGWRMDGYSSYWPKMRFIPWWKCSFVIMGFVVWHFVHVTKASKRRYPR
jgi:hypothetical protein